MADDKERAAIIHDLLSGAIPVNPTNPQFYVTRDEFLATISTIESKIENSALKQRLWVLTGCVAILIGGGAGYASIISRIDQLTIALPELTHHQEAVAPWIQHQEQRGTLQDAELKKLDPSYEPMPYREEPQ